MPIFIGREVGRYHIVEQLGQGGMATVYRAYDTNLERDVALKVIRVDIVGAAFQGEVLKRFKREARSLARLSHPNIVKVHDFGEFEGAPFLVMEYYPGGTLKSRTGRPMPFQEAAKLIAPVARALECAHEDNIIHRDVKPANILLTRAGVPMLSDFGIAKILETEEVSHLTGTGVGIGTPEYMAPEQWTNEVTPQTDIYALGVVFYELVTGKKPYTADTPAAILLKQSKDPLPSPGKYVPGLPDEVVHIIFKALAKNLQERYTNMGAFAAALEGLAGWSEAEYATRPAGQGEGALPVVPPPIAVPDPKAVPVTPAKRSIPRWFFAAGGFGLLGGFLLVALAVYFMVGKFSLSKTPGKPTLEISTPTVVVAGAAIIMTQTSPADIHAAQPSETTQPVSVVPTIPVPAAALPTLTWSRVNSGQNFRRDYISALAIDPQDSAVIYSASRSSGLYKTTNAGGTWQALRGGLFSQQILALAIDPGNHLVIYTVTNGGVYKSLDGGTTWQAKNASLPDNSAPSTGEIIIDAQDHSKITLAYGSGAYLSSDGGETWNERYSGTCPAMNDSLTIDPAAADSWYIVQAGGDTSCKNGIYRSSDAGKTWTLKREKVSAVDFYSTILVEKGSDGKSYLYAIDDQRMLIVSADGGDSWHNSNISNCTSLAAAPKGTTLAACGGKIEHFAGGRLQVESGANNPSGQLLVAQANPQEMLFFTNNPGEGGGIIYISTDGGRNFQEHTSGMGTTCAQLKISPFDSGAMYLINSCDGAGIAFYSADTGSSWQKYRQFQGSSGVIFHNLDFDADAKTMLATSYGEKWLWSTLTRTDNWIVKSNPLGSDAAAADINFTSDPFVAGTLYFMGNNNKNAPVLVTSNDRGSTWNSDRAVTLPLDGPLSGPTLYFDHTRGERMYLVDSGRMITSGDHGNNWSRCADTPATGTSQTLLAVDPRDSRHIYLATQGKGVLASADACQSWSTGAEGLSYPNVNTLALDPANPNLVYAGTDNGVFASNNGGKSWSSANDGLLNNPPVYSFALDTRNSVVYAATPYGIFKLGLK